MTEEYGLARDDMGHPIQAISAISEPTDLVTSTYVLSVAAVRLELEVGRIYLIDYNTLEGTTNIPVAVQFGDSTVECTVDTAHYILDNGVGTNKKLMVKTNLGFNYVSFLRIGVAAATSSRVNITQLA